MGGEEDQLRAVLIVLADVPEELESEYERWWDTEHLPERMECPGIRAGYRWKAVEGEPKHMSLFEMDSVGARFTEPYISSSERPSERTTRILSRVMLQKMVFVERKRVGEIGRPEGQYRGGVLLATFDLPTGRDAEYEKWSREHDENLMEVPGLLRIRRMTAAEAGTPRNGVLLDLSEATVVHSEEYKKRRSDDGREALSGSFEGFRRYLFERA